MPAPVRSSFRRTFLTGGTIVLVCAVLVFTPLILGSGPITKSIVAFSLIGLCIGLSVLVHGAWDWLMR